MGDPHSYINFYYPDLKCYFFFLEAKNFVCCNNTSDVLALCIIKLSLTLKSGNYCSWYIGMKQKQLIQQLNGYTSINRFVINIWEWLWCTIQKKWIGNWKKLWNMQLTIIPIVIGAFGTVTKGLLKGLEDLEIRGRVETIHTTALLRMARILRRVLETWGDLLSLKLQWKTISVSWCEKNSNNNNKNLKIYFCLFFLPL